MLNLAVVRLTICTLCGIAFLQFSVADALHAQRIPQLPPPTVAGDGGNRNQGGADESDRGNRDNSRRASQGKSKFDELLADQDLSKFRGYEEQQIGSGWQIDRKYLHFDGSSIGDIITKKEYENFELQFDYKVSEGTNSGVMYRVSLGDEKPYLSGPEFQILDDENHADGKNEMTSTGSLNGMYAPENKKTRAAGSWNSVRIVVDGKNIKHYLNSIKVVEAEIGSNDWNQRLAESKFNDSAKYAKNSRGHIAFQENGDEVWYRNIRIKDLNADSMASSHRPDTSSRPPAQARNVPKKYAAPGSTRRIPRFYAEGMDVGDKNAKGKGSVKDPEKGGNGKKGGQGK